MSLCLHLTPDSLAGIDNSPIGGMFRSMKPPRLFRFATLLATFMLAIALTNNVQAISARSAKATNAGNSTTLLHEALATLAEADHDYKGHRVAAMKQIHLALGGHAGKNHVGGQVATATHVHHSATAKHTGKGNESQATSDAQLRQAQGLLQRASHEVSGVALQHVNAAISDINTALSIR